MKKLTLYYIKDKKGVTGIYYKKDEADGKLPDHDRAMGDMRGKGEVKKKEVLLADWEAQRVTLQNIDTYQSAGLVA